MPVPVNFALSEMLIKPPPPTSKVLLFVTLSSGPPNSTVVTGSPSKERRMLTPVDVVVRVLLSKLKSAGASPAAGFGGPVSLALSATNNKADSEVMLVLSMAFRNGPESVKDGESSALGLDRLRVVRLVVTVLPLSSMR